MAGEKDAARIDLATLDPDGAFPARLAGDRATLAGHASDLWALGGEAQQERLEQIAALAHRLAGAAGTFGYGPVSDAAFALEARILERRPGETLARWQVGVGQAIGALFSALDHGLANDRR